MMDLLNRIRDRVGRTQGKYLWCPETYTEKRLPQGKMGQGANTNHDCAAKGIQLKSRNDEALPKREKRLAFLTSC